MYDQELFNGCLLISPQTELFSATADMPSTAGVCLLSTIDNHPILLLYGGNLRSLVRRRLQDGSSIEKTRRTHLHPVVERIWFRRSYSVFETQWAYFNIAHTVYPDRFREFFPRLDAWFITVNPDDKYPYFDLTGQISSPRSLYWGPFSTKKSATRFLENLRRLFDLCRHPHLLAQAPDAAGCPYAQMNRCAAVCNGTVTLDHYQKLIHETIDFLDQPIPQGVAALQAKMKTYAADLQFEAAQRLKEKITHAQKLLTSDCRWVVPLDQFYLLIFQPGPVCKIPHRRSSQPAVTPFIAGPDRISQIEPFPLEQAREGARIVLDHLNLTQLQKNPPRLKILAWVAHFLYRKTRDQGLYLPIAQVKDSDELADKIMLHFTQTNTNKKKLKLDTLSLSTPKENENNEEGNNKVV